MLNFLWRLMNKYVFFFFEKAKWSKACIWYAIGDKPIRSVLGSERIKGESFVYKGVVTEKHSPTPSQTSRGQGEKRTSKTEQDGWRLYRVFVTLTTTTSRVAICFHIIGTLPRPCAVSTFFPLTAFTRGLEVRLADFCKRVDIQATL